MLSLHENYFLYYFSIVISQKKTVFKKDELCCEESFTFRRTAPEIEGFTLKKSQAYFLLILFIIKYIQTLNANHLNSLFKSI